MSAASPGPPEGAHATSDDGSFVDTAHWEDHLLYKRQMHNGAHHLRLRRYGHAVLEFREALAVQERVLGADNKHIGTALACEQLANALAAMDGESETATEAMALRNRALRIRRAVEGEKGFGTLRAQANMLRQRLDAAMKQGGGALTAPISCAAQAKLGQLFPSFLARCATLTKLGELKATSAMLAVALGACRTLEAMRVASGARGTMDTEMAQRRAMLLRWIGTTLRKRGLPARAAPPLQQSLSLCEAHLGECHRDTAATLAVLGMTLSHLGDRGAGELMLLRALIARIWLCLSPGEVGNGAAASRGGEQQNNPAAAGAAAGAAAKPQQRRGSLVVRRFSEYHSSAGPGTQQRSSWLTSLMTAGGGAHRSRGDAIANLDMVMVRRAAGHIGGFADAKALLLNPLEFCCGSDRAHAASMRGALGMHPRRPWLLALAMTLNNLGVHFKAGRAYTEALLPLEFALILREQELGLHHADTAQSLLNVGTVYKALAGRAMSCAEENLDITRADICRMCGTLMVERTRQEQAAERACKHAARTEAQAAVAARDDATASAAGAAAAASAAAALAAWAAATAQQAAAKAEQAAAAAPEVAQAVAETAHSVAEHAAEVSHSEVAHVQLAAAAAVDTTVREHSKAAFAAYVMAHPIGSALSTATYHAKGVAVRAAKALPPAAEHAAQCREVLEAATAKAEAAHAKAYPDRSEGEEYLLEHQQLMERKLENRVMEYLVDITHDYNLTDK